MLHFETKRKHWGKRHKKNKIKILDSDDLYKRIVSLIKISVAQLLEELVSYSSPQLLWILKLLLKK